MQAINVLDYGAVADWNGKTGTDNFGAFLQAMDQAATLGVPLRVPAGKYYIVPQGPAPQIKPGEKVFVFGDGPEQTMIKFGPAPDQTTGFYVRAGGDLTLEGLTLEGRRVHTVPYTGDGATNAFRFSFRIRKENDFYVLLDFVSQQLGTDYTVKLSAGGGTVSFNKAPAPGTKILITSTVFHHVFAEKGNATTVKGCRCKFTGGTTPFKMDGGTYALELVDSDFYVQGVGFSVLAVESESAVGAVRFRNCTFKTGNHCMYINRGVSLLVDGCSFEQSGADAYGVHIFGGGLNNPEYVIIRGCLFKPGIAHQVLTSSKIRTQISDCTFIGKPGFISIQVASGGAQVSGCRFLGNPTSQIANFFDEDGDVVALNCRFDGSPTLANVYRYGASEALWRFIGCDFGNNYDGGTAYCVYTKKGDSEFVACKFERGPEYGTDSNYTRISGGRFLMRGCRVVGQRSIWITAELGDVTLQLWENIFRSSDKFGLRIQPLSPGIGGIITVQGGHNLFNPPSIGPEVDESASVDVKGRVKGWLTPPQQRGATILGTDIVVGELKIAPNESFYHVMGTPTITRITLQGQKIFHGPIRLICDGDPAMAGANGFFIRDTENIKPKSTEQRRQHEVVTLVYDPEANAGSGWWYEV